MTLCLSALIPGCCSDTRSVCFSLFQPSPSQQPHPAAHTHQRNKIPSLAFLKKFVSPSLCDRLFMNISYTPGLRGSAPARLRALWQRKQSAQMNSDTRLFRLRKGNRKGKINRIRKEESYISCPLVLGYQIVLRSLHLDTRFW